MAENTCSERGRISEIEKRLGAGDTALALLNEQTGKTHDLVESMNKRLFVDNGTKSVQTRINNMETVARVLIWLSMVLTTMLATVIGRLIYLWITT